MRSNNLILDSLVVHLDRMVRIIATEDKKVLYGELLSLAPSDLETGLLGLVILAFEPLRIEQIIDFLVVDLEE